MSQPIISKEDANKRAIEDYSQFSQYARYSAQFSFAGNGGAAAAILSFLTSITNSATKNPSIDTSTIVRSFSIAASFYLVGVFLSTISMCLLSIAKRNWGNHWEHVALTDTVNFAADYARNGEFYDHWGKVILILSALAFVPGSVFAVAGFFRQ